MAEENVDTEVLLALLLSMVKDQNVSQETLLGALADAGGNVQNAATMLNLRSKGSDHGNSSIPRKRKRSAKLDDWIVDRKAGSSNIRNTNNQKSPRKVEKTPLVISKYITGTIDAPIDIDVEDAEAIVSDVEAPKIKAEPEENERLPEGTSPTKKSAKPAVPLLSILKQAPTNSNPKIPKLLPRTLATPDLVSRYTPCTIHHSILPPELACRLFYVMLREATGWSRNKWWLFDRVVESPHRTSFYARDLARDDPDEMHEAARYWYNGRPTNPPRTFLPEMEEACEIIEKVVNEQIVKRGNFYPVEWPTTPQHPWRANVAASNCYTGSKESVGYHSDQLTYLGPCPTIASLSLGTSRIFRLREVVPQQEKEERNAQTFNIPVTHNSLLIMHASCQERFKHAVPPQQTIDAFKPQFPPPLHDDADQDSRLHLDDSAHKPETEDDGPDMMPPTTSRINITFRFYRPDFRPASIPRCHCGIPTVLRPDMKRRAKDDASGSDKDNGRTIADGGSSSISEDVVGMRYFWMCYAGAQNDGKGCSFFQGLDMGKEGRRQTIVKEFYSK